MSRASVLSRGRRAAEAGMVDRCTIRRRTGETTDDAGHVTLTYGPPDPVYTGRCRVQQPDTQAREETPGEAYVLMLRRELQLPIAVVGLAAGDEVTIDASVDPDLPGRTFVIRDLAGKTHATSRRVQVEEATS